MARKDELKFFDRKGGWKRFKRNGAEALKDVPLGVAKELSSLVAYGCREMTGAKKRTGRYKSNVAKSWFE